MAFPARQQDTDHALRQKEHLLGIIAGIDDFISGLASTRLQQRPDDGQISTSLGNGTLLEVDSRRGRGITCEPVKVAQHVADGSVAMTSLALGTIYGFIQFQFPPGKQGKRLQYSFEA